MPRFDPPPALAAGWRWRCSPRCWPAAPRSTSSSANGSSSPRAGQPAWRPAQRRGHAGRLDRAPLGRERQAACKLHALWLPHAARRRAGAAVPARRAAQRLRAAPSACATCTSSASRCWRSTTAASARARAELPSEAGVLRGRPRRLGLAGARAAEAAALHLRPLAGRRDRGAARRRGGRRARADRRRHLHLDPRRVPQLQVGLAAGHAADHAALRLGRAASRQVRVPVLVVHGSEDCADPRPSSAARCTSGRRRPSASCSSRAARTTAPTASARRCTAMHCVTCSAWAAERRHGPIGPWPPSS